MDSSDPLFKPGDRILLRSQRSEVGTVLSNGDLDGGEYWYRVAFGRQTRDCAEEDLEAFTEEEVSIEDLARSGRWGRLEAFRRVLAVERIRSKNRSTVYAFRAERILFAAHQYKPLLKFLDSQDRRLLIADEVGLGKTIEAGLILTELEARQGVDRVLVVCPSRLREKWKEEMNRKFGQDFRILERRDVLEITELARNTPERRLEFRGIISQQSLRRQDLLEELLGSVPDIDLIIVDEAHHGRNPGTQTTRMIQEIGEITNAMLLLTATPIHLGSRDLQTLLNALRPTEFSDLNAFDEALGRDAPLVAAAAQIRRRDPIELDAIAAKIRQAFGEFPQDPLATHVLELLAAGPPRDARAWTDLEREVEDLHFLAPILTRSRKRDVQEHAPVRRAHVVLCQWSEEEFAEYERFVGGEVGRDGWPVRKLGLGAIQRARQAASSLPAAMHWRPSAGDASDAEQSDLDLDGLSVADDATPNAVSSATGAISDAKLAKLVELLRRIEREESGAKTLIFTFFVGTSHYLEEQLSERGIAALRIAGDVRSTPKRPETDDRAKIVGRFRADPTCRVLVSTEVGSEGLDFQFCHHIVNYDLPWNPMVVEQRIGRIDRFGQKSKVVHIHNFVVEGTVEQRILNRLYERIGIFERSLGVMDAILGRTIQELTQDYVSARLTIDEAERRTEEAAQALIRQQQHLEALEGRVTDLFGHEDHVRAELQRVQRLGRFVSESSILAVLSGFLAKVTPNSRIAVEGPGCWSLPVDEHVLEAVRRHAGADGEIQLKQSLGRRQRIDFVLDGQLAYDRPEAELLNTRHPLVRAASESLAGLLQDSVARTGHAVLRIDPDDDHQLPLGDVLVVVRMQEVRGLRARRFLEPVAVPVGSAEPIDPEVAERLLHLTLEHGQEWFGESLPACASEADWRAAERFARRQNRELREREARENEARYQRQRGMLQRERDLRLELIDRKIATTQQRERRDRVVQMFDAQRMKAVARFETRLQELEHDRQTSVEMTPPIASCLVRVEANRS